MGCRSDAAAEKQRSKSANGNAISPILQHAIGSVGLALRHENHGALFALLGVEQLHGLLRGHLHGLHGRTLALRLLLVLVFVALLRLLLLLLLLLLVLFGLVLLLLLLLLLFLLLLILLLLLLG